MLSLVLAAVEIIGVIYLAVWALSAWINRISPPSLPRRPVWRRKRIRLPIHTQPDPSQPFSPPASVARNRQWILGYSKSVNAQWNRLLGIVYDDHLQWWFMPMTAIPRTSPYTNHNARSLLPPNTDDAANTDRNAALDPLMALLVHLVHELVRRVEQVDWMAWLVQTLIPLLHRHFLAFRTAALAVDQRILVAKRGYSASLQTASRAASIDSVASTAKNSTNGPATLYFTTLTASPVTTNESEVIIDCDGSAEIYPHYPSKHATLDDADTKRDPKTGLTAREHKHLSNLAESILMQALSGFARTRNGPKRHPLESRLTRSMAVDLMVASALGPSFAALATPDTYHMLFLGILKPMVQTMPPSMLVPSWRERVGRITEDWRKHKHADSVEGFIVNFDAFMKRVESANAAELQECFMRVSSELKRLGTQDLSQHEQRYQSQLQYAKKRIEKRWAEMGMLAPLDGVPSNRSSPGHSKRSSIFSLREDRDQSRKPSTSSTTGSRDDQLQPNNESFMANQRRVWAEKSKRLMDKPKKWVSAGASVATSALTQMVGRQERSREASPSQLLSSSPKKSDTSPAIVIEESKDSDAVTVDSDSNQLSHDPSVDDDVVKALEQALKSLLPMEYSLSSGSDYMSDDSEGEEDDDLSDSDLLSEAGGPLPDMSPATLQSHRALSKTTMITIPQFTTVPATQFHMAYTLYHINLQSDTHTAWSIPRRYSDFFALHRRLRRRFGGVESIPFPPKHPFPSPEKRRTALQNYLRSVMAIETVLASEIFRSFLGVAVDAGEDKPDDESQDDPVTPFLLDVFNLQSSRTWFRRQTVGLVSQVVKGVVERKVADQIKVLGSEAWVCWYIDTIVGFLKPAGDPKVMADEYARDVRVRQQEFYALMISHLPDLIGPIAGR